MRLAILLAIVIGFTAGTVIAECVPKEVTLETVSADAGTMKNLAKMSGSLAAESKRLIEKGLASAKNQTAPVCDSACGKSPLAPTVMLSTVPTKFLAEYSDKPSCEKLYAQTRNAPFVYAGRTFSSVDDLNNWFGDFSQGKGKDGNDLYQKCPGDCSPQYFTAITLNDTGYNVDADVICGPARDKDDNTYQLKLIHRFLCAE